MFQEWGLQILWLGERQHMASDLASGIDGHAESRYQEEEKVSFNKFERSERFLGVL